MFVELIDVSIDDDDDVDVPLLHHSPNSSNRRIHLSTTIADSRCKWWNKFGKRSTKCNSWFFSSNISFRRQFGYFFLLLFSNGFAVIVIHFTKHSSLHNCTNTFSPSNFDDDFVLFISLWTLVVGCIYTIVIITLWIISLTLDTDRNHFHTKQNPFHLRLQIDAIIVSAIKTQMKICRRQSEKNKNVHVNLESIDAYGCLC